MSGVEIAVPVIAAVFALVSAFKDGGTIAEKLKERRQRKGAQPPTDRLQRVFQQGVQEIENSKSEGVEDFGNEYLEDHATASKLKDITIILQDSIIKELTAAFHNDDMNDFTPAIDSIIQVRKEAVNVLNEHYLKLQRRRTQGHSQQQQQQQQQRQHPQSPQFASPQPTPQYTRTETRDSFASEAPSSIRTEIYYTQRSGSLTNTADVDTGLQSPDSPQPRNKKWGGLFNRRISSDSSTVTGRKQPSPQQQTAQPPQMQSPPLSNVIPAGERQQTGPTPATTWKLPSPALRRASTTNSMLEPSTGVRNSVVISEENNYAGLCKGAFHAQKMRLNKAMETSMRNYEWMYHCKKCKYRLMADPGRRGNPHFDDRIQTSASTVKFRCLFLWKSHIPVKDGSQRAYSCLICLLTGRKSSTYTGEDNLFWHISRHANEAVVESTIRSGGIGPRTNSALLQGMIEFHSDGVLLADTETFDIEIPQSLRTKEKEQDRPPSFPLLPDSAMSTDEASPAHSRASMTSSPATTGLLQPTLRGLMTPMHEVHGESASNSSRSPSRTMSIPSPEPLRDLPMESPYENAWRQDRTSVSASTSMRYAELEAPVQQWPLP